MYATDVQDRSKVSSLHVDNAYIVFFGTKITVKF